MTEEGFRQNYDRSQAPRTEEATAPIIPRNRGRPIAAMTLKLLAFLLLMAGALAISGLASFQELDLAVVVVAGIVIVVGLVLFTGAAGTYRYARRLEREAIEQKSPMSTNPATAEGLSYSPQPGEGWRETRDWGCFADSVPSAPRPRSWIGPFLPASPVPPDEILRRLWLVRAELTVYYRFGRYMFRHLAVYGFVVCCFLGLLLAAVGIDSLLNQQGRIGIALGVLAFAAAIPTYLNARTLVGDTVATYRRQRALEAEQRRLMDLDAARPEGPAGGPAVQHSLRRAHTSRFIYTPPVDEAMRVIPQKHRRP